MKTIFLIISLLLGIRESTLINLKADKANSNLSYSASHSLHDWTGVNKDVNAVLVLDGSGKINKVAISLKVVDFDSGNASRDSHSLEVLESLKFPKVQFVSTEISQMDGDLKVKGNLTFHGLTKMVEFPVTYHAKRNGIIVEGEIPVSLDEFKVERPSFMLVKIDDLIAITFHLEFYPE